MQNPAVSFDRTSPLAGSALLIVDDHFATRECWRRVLEAAGAHVRCAATVKAACRAIEECEAQLDAVLLDYVLPDGDASRVVRAFAEVCSDPGLLLVTGLPQADAARIARRLRADCWLSKPVAASALLEGVCAAIGARRARQRFEITGSTADQASDEGSPAHQTIDRLAADMLRRAGLTTRECHVAIWNRIYGHSDATTAAQLGIATSTVRGLLARACSELGADDARDLARVLLQQAASAVTMLAQQTGTTQEAVLAPVLDAFESLPMPPPLIQRSSRRRDAAASSAEGNEPRPLDRRVGESSAPKEASRREA